MHLKIVDRSDDIFNDILIQIDEFLRKYGEGPEVIEISQEQKRKMLMIVRKKGNIPLGGCALCELEEVFGFSIMVKKET